MLLLTYTPELRHEVPQPCLTGCKILRRCYGILEELARKDRSWLKVLKAKEVYLENKRTLDELEVLTAEVRSTVMRLHQVHDILDRQHAEKHLVQIIPTKKPRKQREPKPKQASPNLAEQIKGMSATQLMEALKKAGISLDKLK